MNNDIAHYRIAATSPALTPRVSATAAIAWKMRNDGFALYADSTAGEPATINTADLTTTEVQAGNVSCVPGGTPGYVEILQDGLYLVTSTFQLEDYDDGRIAHGGVAVYDNGTVKQTITSAGVLQYLGLRSNTFFFPQDDDDTILWGLSEGFHAWAEIQFDNGLAGPSSDEVEVTMYHPDTPSIHLSLTEKVSFAAAEHGIVTVRVNAFANHLGFKLGVTRTGSNVLTVSDSQFLLQSEGYSYLRIYFARYTDAGATRNVVRHFDLNNHESYGAYTFGGHYVLRAGDRIFFEAEDQTTGSVGYHGFNFYDLELSGHYVAPVDPVVVT